MPDSRRARRIADPGLQPERTSLAWLRTLLGYGALLALVARYTWDRASELLLPALAVVFLIALVIQGYVRRRNVMDITISDFALPRAVMAKMLIALAVCALAVLLVMSHLYRLLQLTGVFSS
ncbi:DUF202 domain-containing protein [Budviciaceae bacterium BWR-B9]|uniref:DUF202 domain-containing protein n=1 Tax=Limnobaculum allomyrinae TaxID=2791986 RepID=A0ABS1IP82_9GAMM|nr:MULTISPECIES: DUF202 domain-containing protein [Limnobaculum]MBK5143341.1 DUF202 domain-containing protein [Limnobaculum allomyrinae]MBV7691229.1 DUF202 domain-containing protein [Limnobaculum sp. M2-1]